MTNPVKAYFKNAEKRELINKICDERQGK